jgi:hypothetical protein
MGPQAQKQTLQRCDGWHQRQAWLIDTHSLQPSLSADEHVSLLCD